MDFCLFQTPDGRWYWRLIDRQGRVLAACVNGYLDFRSCAAAVELVKGSWAAPVLVEDEGHRLPQLH